MAFPVAQVVKNLSTVQESRVCFLGREDPLEKGISNPLQDSCLEKSMEQRILAGCSPCGHLTESDAIDI